MVTCKMDPAVVPKMSRPRKTSSTSSGFRLLDSDQLDTHSSVSRNSIYKSKIDSMFDETRSITNQRFDDRRGSHRTRSIIMYGKSELPTTNQQVDSLHNNNNNNNTKKCSTTNQQKEQKQQNDDTVISASVNDDFRHSSESKSDIGADDDADDGDGDGDNKQNDSGQINNSVQAQIERMFTDVVKDATCSFAVRCLGSLPLKDKVTSLQGLQEPLRQLYLRELGQGNQCNGQLDICGGGLRIRQNFEKDVQITPFHNIAVWSAVKFIVSQDQGGAAFLPLITDPESIDKASLFRPLTAADQRRLSSGLHAPIVAVVMRSSGPPKFLECHGFVCQTSEDAIVIAATLYQSLMSHVNSNSNRSTKRNTPRNQNGVSCISIASSSALTGSNYISRSNGSLNGVGRKNSLRSNKGAQTPSLPVRKKRIASSSLSGGSDKIYEKTTEERKKKSHKTKRAPPIPTPARNNPNSNSNITRLKPQTIPAAADIIDFDSISGSDSYSVTPKPSSSSGAGLSGSSNSNGRNSNIPGKESQYHARGNGGGGGGVVGEGGDILTRVAIPRSGSFLNTGGLTRYKSRATQRHSNKNDIGLGGGGGGGGGGSPLGFSELFNEFRLHENLHSLDDILSAIINADGMSFNDLKPIYKEFLLKLAVTLTKDELYQRSKNIMRRQKKKKLKRKNSNVQKKSKYFILGFGLKKVFRFGKFRSNKSNKSNNSSSSNKKSITQINGTHMKNKDNHRKCGATIGSDFSMARNENTLNGLNRNSSSGYVSCSECSYDSEACTCATADRCYCSLGADHDHIKEKFKQQQKQRQQQKSNSTKRNNLKSYRNDDKCYCSMGDTPPPDDDGVDDDNDDDDTNSETTWCDTDSCHSLSKCYCKSRIRHQQQINKNTSVKDFTNQLTNLKSSKIKHSVQSKFGLNYDLFTIDKRNERNHHHRYNHHHINNKNKNYRTSEQPFETLSVKKSVEAAAIFADVKLSQTTDIKSLRPLNGMHNIINQKYTRNVESISISKKFSNNKQRHESKSSDRPIKSISSGRSNQQNYRKSYSADDILSKLTEKSSNYRASNKNSLKGGTVGESYYQSMRAVSASLEDSLGYLP